MSTTIRIVDFVPDNNLKAVTMLESLYELSSRLSLRDCHRIMIQCFRREQPLVQLDEEPTEALLARFRELGFICVIEPSPGNLKL